MVKLRIGVKKVNHNFIKLLWLSVFMDSRKYHICRNCGHLRLSHKFEAYKTPDHHCFICECKKFFGYDEPAEKTTGNKS